MQVRVLNVQKREGAAKMEDDMMQIVYSDEENDMLQILDSDEENDVMNVIEEEAEQVDDEEEADVGTGLKRKKKSEAAIWVSGVARKENNRAVCLICNKDYAMTGGNTSVIRTHILQVHPNDDLTKKFEELDDQKKRKKEEKNKKKTVPKLTMDDFIVKKGALKESDHAKFTEAVADYIVQTNQSLATIENPAFRKMLFTINSNYVAPSRITITNRIDQKITAKKKELKEEILKDIATTNTLAVTSDGGPSQNKNKTKKNTVTAHRVSDEWKMKSDTLALKVAEGSQSGPVLRKVVKDVLDDFGNNEWDVNMTTDDASAARSSRDPNRHPEVGLYVKYDVPCLDHQIHLLVNTKGFHIPSM
jgi:hypothetical protein